MPSTAAQQIYSRVKASKQHPEFPNRWVSIILNAEQSRTAVTHLFFACLVPDAKIVPCDSVISFSIRVNDHTYNIPDEGMIQTKGQGECWGAVTSWDTGKAPDQAGRVILGTPFLAYYYT